MAKDTGGMAFPMPGSTDGNGNVTYPEFGMSLRDYFAGQALIGLIGKLESDAYDSVAEASASCGPASYEFADALLEARNK